MVTCLRSNEFIRISDDRKQETAVEASSSSSCKGQFITQLFATNVPTIWKTNCHLFVNLYFYLNSQFFYYVLNQQVTKRILKLVFCAII